MRCSAYVTDIAMVNVDYVSPSLWLGLVVAGSGVVLYTFKMRNSKGTEDADIVTSSLLVLVGGILLLQGWRLDPILMLSEFVLAGVGVFYITQTVALRKQLLDNYDELYDQSARWDQSEGMPYGDGRRPGEPFLPLPPSSSRPVFRDGEFYDDGPQYYQDSELYADDAAQRQGRASPSEGQLWAGTDGGGPGLSGRGAAGDAGWPEGGRYAEAGVAGRRQPPRQLDFASGVGGAPYGDESPSSQAAGSSAQNGRSGERGAGEGGNAPFIVVTDGSSNLPAEWPSRRDASRPQGPDREDWGRGSSRDDRPSTW